MGESGQFRILCAFRCVARFVSIASLSLGWSTKRTGVFQIRLSVQPGQWTSAGLGLREFMTRTFVSAVARRVSDYGHWCAGRQQPRSVQNGELPKPSLHGFIA